MTVETLRETVLCVDDDPITLKLLRRSLEKVCEVATADSAESALKLIRNKASFAVVVSDMKMPGMDGIDFLAQTRKLLPLASRIMITSDSDQTNTINALNQGELFRFAKKPLNPVEFAESVVAGIKQFRTASAEKDILQRTLNGSVRALVEVISMANPAASRLSGNLKKITDQLRTQQKLDPSWPLELAAMLAPISYVTLPDTFWSNFETKRKSLPPQILSTLDASWLDSAKIVRRIPRLERVARIIRLACEESLDAFKDQESENLLKSATTLKVAEGYNRLRHCGQSKEMAIDQMLQESPQIEHACIRLLFGVELPVDTLIVVEIPVDTVEEEMILAEDLYTNDGLMLAANGLNINLAMLNRILSFNRAKRMRPTLLVYMNSVEAKERELV